MTLMDILLPQTPPDPKNVSFVHRVIDPEPRYETPRPSKESREAKERIAKRLEKRIKWASMDADRKERERARKKAKRLEWLSTKAKMKRGKA